LWLLIPSGMWPESLTTFASIVILPLTSKGTVIKVGNSRSI
jgi:hypothetical protein